MKYLINNEKDLENVAHEVLSIINSNKYNHATVLALQGDLGAGKTTFTKCLANILGITESVTSPTFVIQKTFSINETNLENNSNIFIPFKQLIHIDSYRLDLSGELLHLGWHDNLNQKDNLIIVEWPERISDILPTEYLLLKFSHINETAREVELFIIDSKNSQKTF